MNPNDIIRIASEANWQSIITPAESGESYIDFLHNTSSGQPFVLSTCWTDNKCTLLINDIENIEKSFDIEKYLDEFLESIEYLSPETYFCLLKELDEIHTKIWLLWANLKYHQENEDTLNTFPWFIWN